MASPLGAIAAAAMMLDFLGEADAGCRIEESIARVLATGKVPSADARSGLSTCQVGDLLAREVAGLQMI